MNEKVEFALDVNGPEKIRPDLLDTFQYNGTEQLIQYVTKEFSALCPFSGLPDIAEIHIEYIPDRKCIELKSLKFYFLSYRNVGIYQEHATHKIFQDLFTAIEPRWLRIKTMYATRGGIDSTCTIEKGQRNTDSSKNTS